MNKELLYQLALTLFALRGVFASQFYYIASGDPAMKISPLEIILSVVSSAGYIFSR